MKQCSFCDGHVGRYGAKFCSIACSSDARKIQMRQSIESGLISIRPTLRKFLLERKGNRCCDSCGLDTWLNKPLPLELDHIDGNPANNLPCNLRLICSNCHSITPSWKAKNKGNGRKSRNIPTY